MKKFLKTRVFYINNFEPKTVKLEPDIWLIMILNYFFVVYVAYVNISILDEKYFELVPKMMYQGILKNVTPRSWGSVDNPSTCGIFVDVG